MFVGLLASQRYEIRGLRGSWTRRKRLATGRLATLATGRVRLHQRERCSRRHTTNQLPFRRRPRGIPVTTTDSDIYYDPYDFEIDTDPYPIWRRLREERPLYYNERYDF